MFLLSMMVYRKLLKICRQLNDLQMKVDAGQMINADQQLKLEKRHDVSMRKLYLL